jgi:hypothetical protein
MVAGWPFTYTSPAAISASAARREHKPASAMNFWMRTGSIGAGWMAGGARRRNEIHYGTNGACFAVMPLQLN